MRRPLALHLSSLSEHHVSSSPHPENPERIKSIYKRLLAAGVFERVHLVGERLANLEELLMSHSRDHVVRVLKTLDLDNGDEYRFDPDTYATNASYDVASSAVGSTLNLLADMIHLSLYSGISLVRPPGHHAESDRAMGFCLFNTIAIAASWLRSIGLKRVAIIDIDVHHGNGTQEIFFQDPHVLFVSCHQFPFYPGTGAANEIGRGRGKGFTVNLPFPPGLTDELLIETCERVMVPCLETFKPEAILVSAGFDGDRLDPLGQFNLTSYGFMEVFKRLEALRLEFSGCFTAYILEGGYNVDVLGQTVLDLIDMLMHGEFVKPERNRDELQVSHPLKQHLSKIPEMVQKRFGFKL